MMELDPTTLMLSLLFGMVGMGIFMYGKKAASIPHIAAGFALMACPYFIPNLIAMSIVCLLLTIAPFVISRS